MLGRIAAVAVGLSALDTLGLPKAAATRARSHANRLGKPLLNVGAGTASSSLRVALIGPANWGDINCDLSGTGPCPTVNPDHVCQCDIYKLAWPNKYFGAAIASHVFGSLDRPEAALRELGRVANKVYIVLPKWWSPSTWIGSAGRGPGHPTGYRGKVYWRRGPELRAWAREHGIELEVW